MQHTPSSDFFKNDTAKSCMIVLVFMGIIIGLVLLLMILGGVFLFHTWKMHTKSGALHNFQEAMYSGNGEKAVLWGETIVQKWNKENEFDNLRFYQLGSAYELNGEYEKAVEIYLKFVNSKRAESMDLARVYFKQGNLEQSFFEYCAALEKHKSDVWKKIIPNHVMCKHFGKSKEWLCPFSDYHTFMQFMEEEYAKLDSPEAYTQAMQIFRAIAEEIDEEHLPRSGASKELDARKAKILAERKQAIKE